MVCEGLAKLRPCLLGRARALHRRSIQASMHLTKGTVITLVEEVELPTQRDCMVLDKSQASGLEARWQAQGKLMILKNEDIDSEYIFPFLRKM